MSFDPNVFMTQQFDEASATRVTPCPAGEYHAVIMSPEDIKFKDGIGKDGGKWMMLSVAFAIDNPSVVAATDRNPTKVRYETFLDLTEDGKSIAMGQGKNIGLGRLREAAGLNQDGRPFRLTDLVGKRVKVQVNHRPSDKDPTIIYDEVKRVAAG